MYSVPLLLEVSFRKLVPRTRLEVPLEAQRHPFSPKLHADVDQPRPPRRRGPILPGVVRREARRQIGGHAHVAATGLIHAADDVDEPPRWVGHASAGAKTGPAWNCGNARRKRREGSRYADLSSFA